MIDIWISRFRDFLILNRMKKRFEDLFYKTNNVKVDWSTDQIKQRFMAVGFPHSSGWPNDIMRYTTVINWSLDYKNSDDWINLEKKWKKYVTSIVDN